MKALLIAAMALSAPVAAQEARPVLWNDLHAGMSKDEVKALYPKGNTKLSANCYASLSPDYRNKGLVSVKLQVNGRGCATMVVAGLNAKYGEGRSEETSSPTWVRGVTLEEVHYYWAGSGVALHLDRLKNSEDGFDLTYTAADQADTAKL